MEIIDLTHPLSGDTPLFPGDPPFSLSRIKTCADDGYNAFRLSAGLHTGTHVDAPLHVLPDGRTIADYPPIRFCGRGVLLDVRGLPSIGYKPAYETLVPSGTAVLLHTGFDIYFHSDPERYFHGYPPLEKDMCAFLHKKGVQLLGMDTPSPDYPPYALHRLLLSHDICILENLTNLQALRKIPDFTVMALPLPLAAEASPVRAVAFYD